MKGDVRVDDFSKIFKFLVKNIMTKFINTDWLIIENVTSPWEDGESYKISQRNKSLFIDISWTALSEMGNTLKIDIKKVFDDYISKTEEIKITSSNIAAFITTYSG